ncbi:2OG-Fe(II) oxygenase [Acidocella sp.]|uniref:2OG-Fe(II) oxygenase n=1 Tax=Acidocella sp. TaxID=50710 RepID=UPI002D802D6D|nr:2OG-Fe(II) oxygenase [Acidocella sp.]
MSIFEEEILMLIQCTPRAGAQWPDFDTISEKDSHALAAAFQRASPFPHLVMDHLFPSPMLQAMAKEFDTAAPSDWREYHSGLQRKRGTPPGGHLPPTVQDYFNVVYSGPFVRLLSRITGIDDLIPDPALYGGGMHEVDAGGSFEIHMDFATHPRTRLVNRLALITYFNETWTSEDGGALELWELEPPRCAATVVPHFGRTVIMEQSARAAHGHPQPIREGRQRRSTVAYFYTNGLAARDANDTLATTYVPHAGYSRRQKAELYLRRFAPPMIVKGLKAINKAARTRHTRGRGSKL